MNIFIVLLILSPVVVMLEIKDETFDLMTFTWVTGSKNSDQITNTYLLGHTYHLDNSPGGRAFGCTWKENEFETYMFGGYGLDRSVVPGYLGDVWSYSRTQSYWKTYDRVNPAHGPLNRETVFETPLKSDEPGSRLAMTCIKAGSIPGVIIFGGETMNSEVRNEMWRYYGGSLYQFLGGQLNEKSGGSYIKSNIGIWAQPTKSWPSARRHHNSWTNNNGSLIYTFGGITTEGWVTYNDLFMYRFSESTGVLTHTYYAGPTYAVDFESRTQTSVHGTPKTLEASNWPSSRCGSSLWRYKTNKDRVFIYGGYGYYDSNEGPKVGYLADIWVWDNDQLMWAYVQGEEGPTQHHLENNQYGEFHSNNHPPSMAGGIGFTYYMQLPYILLYGGKNDVISGESNAVVYNTMWVGYLDGNNDLIWKLERGDFDQPAPPQIADGDLGVNTLHTSPGSIFGMSVLDYDNEHVHFFGGQFEIDPFSQIIEFYSATFRVKPFYKCNGEVYDAACSGFGVCKPTNPWDVMSDETECICEWNRRGDECEKPNCGWHPGPGTGDDEGCGRDATCVFEEGTYNPICICDESSGWGGENPYYYCDAICEPACTQENTYCYEPWTCSCSNGYEDIDPSPEVFNCIPVCSECPDNSTCVSPENCQCNEGYSSTYGLESWLLRRKVELMECIPICRDGGCFGKPYSECSAPDVCTCIDGYYDDVGICIPICSNITCGSGAYCESPNVCECLAGHDPNPNNTITEYNCTSECDPPCGKNAICNMTECYCPANHTGNGSVCDPICSGGCVAHAECTAPDTCTCVYGYFGNDTLCKPICERPSCSRNGECVSPYNCTCNNGYDGDGYECHPICTVKCEENNFFYCSAPEICSCIEEYELNDSNSTCVPICTGNFSCGENAFCDIPGFCDCEDRHEGNPFEGCRPTCNTTCALNAECAGVDNCVCSIGWNATGSDPIVECLPECSEGCQNHAICVANETCQCLSNYFEYEGTCYPLCAERCASSASCIEPNVCACNEGYDGVDAKIRCDPQCLAPVCSTNATCEEPEICSCWENFYYLESENLCMPMCFPPCQNNAFECVYTNITGGPECVCNENDYYDVVTCEGNICEDDCNDNGYCSEPHHCICYPGFDGDSCDVEIADDDQPPKTWWDLNQIYVLAGSIAGGVLVILIFLVIVLIIVVSIIACALKSNKKNQRDKIEIVLNEEEKKSTADINVNSELFKINYDDLDIKEKIGQGGSSSVVFLAVWNTQDVAFKCFQMSQFVDDKFELFEKEVSVMASLSHPFILRFFGATVAPPRVGIVMEFCEAGDVNDYIKNHPKLDITTRVRFCTEIAEGCKYLHSKNVWHRDLKGENVLLTRSLGCRIMDFGLSRCIERMSVAKTVSIGTSHYMAPEITRGEDYNEKVDVFSYAMMMFEILTGITEPFGTDLSFKVEFKIAMNADFRPNLDSVQVDEEESYLLDILQMSWKMEPEKRPSFGNICESFKNKSAPEITKKVIIM